MKEQFYRTDNLLRDYEQWLNGFRFLTSERITVYLGYLQDFISDAEKHFYVENIIDSLASIASYDHLHGTNYALLTCKMLFSVHYDNTLSHLPEPEKCYFERRKALAKLDELLMSDTFKEKIKDIQPADETLISEIKKWSILHKT